MRKFSLLVLGLGLVAMAGAAFAEEAVENAGASYSDPYLIASSRVTPEYPPAPMAARFDGSVTVAAHVLSDGTVGRVEVLHSRRPNLGFEEATIDAVQTWRFHPATQGGEPVEAVTLYTLEFRVPGPRSNPNPYVTAGFVASAPAPAPFESRNASQPFVLPDFTTATGEDIQVGLAKPTLPPCAEVGCMYDRSLLVPDPHRRIANPQR